MADNTETRMPESWTNENGTFQVEGDFISCLNCAFTWHSQHRMDDPEDESCPICELAKLEPVLPL